jgi:multimeric flavodoxin WrbA
MKILAINASPRGMQGNTGRLLDEVLAGVKQGGADVEVINLKNLTVQPCVACDICHKTGVCGIRDDYEMIKAKLLSCDGFIVASPNYIYSVTAQLKALFDRCNGLMHCVALEGKYAAAVETSGGGEDQIVLDYMGRFINMTGAQTVGGVGSGMAGVRSFPDEERLFAKANSLGLELCCAIRDKKVFPEQEPFRQGFKGHMQGLVDAMKNEWVFEHEFWTRKTLKM